jgi:hypothetical protein
MFSKKILPLFLLFWISFTVAQTQERPITVNAVKNQNNSVDISYEKSKPGTYTVQLKFKNLDNTSINDFVKIIKDKSGILCTLRPKDPNQGIGYTYSVTYAPGNFKAKVDSTYRYLLPFKNGKNYLVYESKNVNEVYFNKKREIVFKSYAIRAKNQDSIYAMRKGIVIEVANKQSNKIQEEDLVFTTQRNCIRVEHEDGTYATYNGFKSGSISVKEGDTVYPSSFLGVIDEFKKENFLFNFDVYYPVKEINNNDFKSMLSHNYLTPYFHTTAGDVQLVDGKEYTAVVKDEFISTEMSKKEIKAFLNK